MTALLITRQLILGCAIILFPLNLASANAQGSGSGPVLTKVEEDGGRVEVEVTGNTDLAAVKCIWKRITDAGKEKFVFQAVTAKAAHSEVPLVEVLKTGLGGYLDVRIHFAKQGVVSDVPAEMLVDEMQQMINAAIARTTAAPPRFRFSGITQRLIQDLVQVDWSQAKAVSIGGGNEQDKYLAFYYYVRGIRNELEASMSRDLMPFARNIIDPVLLEDDNLLEGTICGAVFDKDKYLCALDLGMDPLAYDGPDPGLAISIVAAVGPPVPTEEMHVSLDEQVVEEVKLRKRDRWLKGELDRLNARMDAMDQTKEVLVIRDRMEDLQAQIDDIRLELIDIVEGRTRPENPIAGLSDLTGKNVSVFFREGSMMIDPEHQVLLNEVFAQMARSPRERVLITGYSDPSGSAQANLRLSERRAQAVRRYLMSRGISEDRLLINFFGESRSKAGDGEDRRVEIEWLYP